MRAVVELWRGELPLGRAFWLWGVLGGGVVALFATILALALVTAGARLLQARRQSASEPSG